VFDSDTHGVKIVCREDSLWFAYVRNNKIHFLFWDGNFSNYLGKMRLLKKLA
jgi:hypothetical protein